MAILTGTAKNCSIVFVPNIDPLASFILTGFANENIITIPDVDIVKSTMGNDGTRQLSVVAKQIEGDFNFWANSPALSKIYDIQTGVYLLGEYLAGTLTVVFPTLVKAFSYPNMVFLSAPKGLEAADEVKPVKIKWASDLPGIASFGAAASLLAGLI